MSNTVFLVVLLAAFMHAAWNAIIKDRGDRFFSISTLGVAQGVIALCLTPFVGMPEQAVWGWIAASAALHTGYKLFLIRAYTAGDLGQVYPLARGSAPLLSSPIALLFLHETLGPFLWAGVVTLCAGIALMSFKGGVARALDASAVFWALGTSLFITGYTIVDAVGARAAESAATYIVWMFVFDGLAIALVYAGVRRGRVNAALRELPFGVLTACLSLGAYGLIIWAMTQAPIGAVAALRESSILFALAISVLFLKERASVWRIASAVLILIGVALMRIA
ncbi:MAG TPA: EamA family transporter [Parvularculaceae bacterium]|nr:EamA family transporter [Parvularculaceae bacterium]